MTAKTKSPKPAAIEHVAQIQEKAKAAVRKGAETLGEIRDFTKGNVEAVVQTGKVLGAGLKDMGSTCAADGRNAIQTLTADVRELTGIKSADAFLKFNAKVLSRNLEAALALSSRNADTMVKLAKDAAAPLSKRVSETAEAIRKAA